MTITPDTILIGSGAIVSALIVGYVITTVYRARGNRPVEYELKCPDENDKSASTVNLSDYVDTVANNFHKSLDLSKKR